jgi:hypothetical protein
MNMSVSGRPLSLPATSSLYELLKTYTIPIRNGRNNRRGFPKHRSLTLGITKARFSGVVGLSYYSKKYPELYQTLRTYGESICDFPFQSIHVNHNVTCPPHKDSNNQTKSCIVSFGPYTGGELVIVKDGIHTKHITLENPVIFNGNELEHYNLPHTGDKYSIVFY